MQQKLMVQQALQAENPIQEVLLQGWVRTKREAKGFCFLELNDGSCLHNLQVIVNDSLGLAEEMRRINTGAAVSVQGDLMESPGKGQKWELQAKDLQLLGEADPEQYPLQKKRHSDEFLRSIAHLRPRTNKYGALYRIRSELCLALHEFLHSQDFFYVQTPIITSLDCEGAGELFQVTSLDPEQPGQADISQDFFGKKAYLTVSGQLAAEVMACGLGRVYSFGPTFRAEDSNTPRHAAEFWMLEPEAAFMDLEQNMDLARDLLKGAVERVCRARAQDLELFSRFVDKDLSSLLDNLLERDFVRLPYSEAVEILHKAGKKETFQFEPAWGRDLQTEHERHLTEKHFQAPVFVYDYPQEIKPFYMRLNPDGSTVAAMDLLLPRVGEIIGGSQREERLQVLEDRMQQMGLRPEGYQWYLDLRRFGTVPHSGFGLGLERLLMFMTGVHNIRDVLPFPRTPQHLEF
ncbi:MAG: asparagine--tRNA ligase [Desulfohalobiaceae bacterium]